MNENLVRAVHVLVRCLAALVLAGCGDAFSTSFALSAADASDEAGTNPDRDGGSCAAATTTDPHNCGGCGHDCLGGACAAGVCQPVAIRPPTGGRSQGPVLIAGGRVVWLEVPALGNAFPVTCPVAGCPPPGAAPLNAPTLNTVPSGALASDGTSVFLVDDTGRVLSCPATGCSGSPAVVYGNNDVAEIAWAGGVLFLIRIGATSGLYKLDACVSGPCTTTLRPVSPTIVKLGGLGLAVGTSEAFWPVGAGPVMPGNPPIAYACPLVGCPGGPTALRMDGLNLSPAGLLAHGTSLYAILVGANNVPFLAACDPKGCFVSQTTIATDVGLAVVDDDGAFWTSTCAAPGMCSSIATTGRVLATQLHGVTAIATDGASVFWTDSVGGVWRVAK
jgi:hypothetical protein